MQNETKHKFKKIYKDDDHKRRKQNKSKEIMMQQTQLEAGANKR